MDCTQKIGRRTFLHFAVLSAAGAVVAACSGGTPPSSPVATAMPSATPPSQGTTGQQPTSTLSAKPTPASNQQPTTAPAAAPKPSGVSGNVRLVAWGDVQDKDVYDAIARQIIKVNPKLNVSVEQYPGGYYEKIQANFAAGSAADVIYFQGWKWQAFADAGVLASLDDLIKQDKLGQAWPDIENYKNNTTWHGATYMSPTDVGSLVIYYNKDLFDKKGVRYPQKGWKYEDFKKIVQSLSFEDGGTKYFGWSQAGGWNGAYGRSVVFMRRNGTMEWDRPVEPTKAKWTQTDIVDALQFTIYETIKNGWCPSPSMIQGGGISVASGRVAMVLEGPWYLPQMWGDKAARQGGINYDVVDPPVGSTEYNYNFAHVHGHTMAKQSKVRDAGWEVIKYILSDDGQTAIAQGGRMCGTPENIQKIWAPIASKAYNFKNTDAFVNGMKEGSTPLIMGQGFPIDAYGGSANPVATAWDQMLGLKATAKEALETANPQIQKLLDDYWAKRK